MRHCIQPGISKLVEHIKSGGKKKEKKGWKSPFNTVCTLEQRRIAAEKKRLRSEPGNPEINQNRRIRHVCPEGGFFSSKENRRVSCRIFQIHFDQPNGSPLH